MNIPQLEPPRKWLAARQPGYAGLRSRHACSRSARPYRESPAHVLAKAEAAAYERYLQEPDQRYRIEVQEIEQEWLERRCGAAATDSRRATAENANAGAEPGRLEQVEFKVAVAERLIELVRNTPRNDPHRNCLQAAAAAAVKDASATLSRHMDACPGDAA